MRYSRSGPPFCAEPTLQKRERIKTAGGEGRNFTRSRTEGRTDTGLSVEFNARVNHQTQVKQHYFSERGEFCRSFIRPLGVTMGLPVQAFGGGCLSPSIVIENLAKNIYNPEVRASVRLLSTIETISDSISPRCRYLMTGCLIQSLGQASIFCFFSLFPVFWNPPFLHAHLANQLICFSKLTNFQSWHTQTA